MSDISKIKVGGTSHNIKDKPLTERVSELDEVVANALADHEERTSLIEEIAATALNNLNDVTNIGPLTDAELDRMFNPPVPMIIYTEDFEDYDKNDYADEWGYGDFEEMLAGNSGDDWMQYGCQKFVETEMTFEYDGDTYKLMELYCSTQQGEEPEFVGLYAMLPADATKEDLAANSMKADWENDYCPFAGLVQEESVYTEWGVGDSGTSVALLEVV